MTMASVPTIVFSWARPRLRLSLGQREHSKKIIIPNKKVVSRNRRTLSEFASTLGVIRSFGPLVPISQCRWHRPAPVMLWYWAVRVCVRFVGGVSFSREKKSPTPGSLVPLWYLVEHIEFLHGRYFCCFFAHKNAALGKKSKRTKSTSIRDCKKFQSTFCFFA